MGLPLTSYNTTEILIKMICWGLFCISFNRNICLVHLTTGNYHDPEDTGLDGTEWLLINFVHESGIQNHRQASSHSLVAILPSLISPNQTAFLKGRRISDNVGLCREFMIGFNHKGDSYKACISLDFKSAMEKMGIDSTFCKIIKVCIKFTSFVALVEGSPTNIFRAFGGIR